MLVLMENIANGKKKVKYMIEATVNGQWKARNKFPIAEPLYNPNSDY